MPDAAWIGVVGSLGGAWVGAAIGRRAARDQADRDRQDEVLRAARTVWAQMVWDSFTLQNALQNERFEQDWELRADAWDTYGPTLLGALDNGGTVHGAAQAVRQSARTVETLRRKYVTIPFFNALADGFKLKDDFTRTLDLVQQAIDELTPHCEVPYRRPWYRFWEKPNDGDDWKRPELPSA